MRHLIFCGNGCFFLCLEVRKSNIFEAVKESVTTRQAAEYYGVQVGRNGMACCPFHDDKHPSMKIDAKSEENPTFIRVGMLILDRLVAVDSLGVQHYNTPVVITPIPIVSEFAPRGLDRLNIFLFHICCVDYYSSILSSMSVKQDFGGRRLNFSHALRRASAAVLALTV